MTYVCPICGVEKKKKNHIDFHLKYGHSEVYSLLQEDVEVRDLEEKLDNLLKQRRVLEEEISLIQSIIEMRRNS